MTALPLCEPMSFLICVLPLVGKWNEALGLWIAAPHAHAVDGLGAEHSAL